MSVKIGLHTLQIQDGQRFLHFDRTGRFLFAAEPSGVIRRGLNHRMLEVRLEHQGSQRLRRYADWSPSQKEMFLQEAYDVALSAVQHEASPDAAAWVDWMARWSPETLQADEDAFRRVYQPISILPPDQYRALVVQLSEGCSYNQCLFCDFYRDRPFHIKSATELDRHLDGIRDFFGERLQDRTGVFLGDGNALIVPTQRLIPALQNIQSVFGSLADRMFTFMDTFSLDFKPQAELEEIRRHGLQTVYIGLESGCDTLRTFLKKPGSAGHALESMRRLKNAGFTLGVIVIVGIGGKSFMEDHRALTVSLLESIGLDEGDIVYLSPFVEPHNPFYAARINDSPIIPMSEPEIQDEWVRWKETLRHRVRAKVSLYSIEEHIY